LEIAGAGDGKKGIGQCKEDFTCDLKLETVINPFPGYD
jgi:hypothetical protein